MFTGGINKVYILDRVEDNPLLAPDGTHAFGSEYDLRSRCNQSPNKALPAILNLFGSANTIRATTVQTNTFCAGGSALGNGTWSDPVVRYLGSGLRIALSGSLPVATATG